MIGSALWSSGRRRWLLAIGAVLLLVAAVGAAATIGRDGAGAPATARNAPASDADVAAVTEVLRRHGDALLHRDRARWLDDIDPSDTAAVYREAQAALFDNIADVSLTSWRYEVVSPVSTPDAIDAAAERLEARVVIMRVNVSYALRNADPAPTSHPAWLTFTHRGGRWALAGDTDVAAQAGESWRGPWDFGPVTVYRSEHTIVLTHPATAVQAPSLAQLVESAMPRVDRVWGTDWNHQVVVVVPNDAAEFEAISGETGETSSLAAVTVSDDVTADGTVTGERLVLNPQNLGALSATGRRLVIQHELAHVATKAVTNDNMPTWLVEGFADYVGNLPEGEPIARTAAELAAEIRAGRIPSALPRAADFVATNAKLGAVYEQAWLACRLIARQYGQAALVRFYRAVASEAELDPDNATARAFSSVLHTDEARFTASWRTYLQSELRS